MLFEERMEFGNANRQRGLGICVLLSASLMLSACQRNPENAAKSETSEVFERQNPANRLDLQPILAEELEEHVLAGDQGCYFADSPASDPLLVARGLMQSPGTKAVMLIKYAGQVVQGEATEVGGYDAIVDGSTFDTAAMTVDVARTGEVSRDGGLQPAHAALRVRQAGQPEVVLQGYWTCGA